MRPRGPVIFQNFSKNWAKSLNKTTRPPLGGDARQRRISVCNRLSRNFKNGMGDAGVRKCFGHSGADRL